MFVGKAGLGGAVWALIVAILLMAAPASGCGCQDADARRQDQPASADAADGKAARPNILLIVIDDLGYSDLGAYGGEIRTPHIDALAESGVLMTDFHTSSACSPSRAMLLTGIDNHLIGLGNLDGLLTDNQRGQPGYEEHLNHRAVTLATLLRNAGYNTYMAGKWHLGEDAATRPEARGFDRSFAQMGGYPGSHFDLTPSPWTQGPKEAFFNEGEPVEELPEGFFSTEFYTDRILEYLRSGADSGKPFFAYLAFSAVHWPLQAPESHIERYRGRYDEGYDRLRNQRLERMQALGIVGKSQRRLPDNPGVPPWASLPPEDRRRQARSMEVYAAMLEHVDDSVGRLLNHLRDAGEYSNTTVVLMSDNGPAAADLNAPGLTAEYLARFDTSLDNLGRRNSLALYGPGWAQASATPLRLFKHFTTEGGVRVPLIISGAGVRRANEMHRGFIHVTDLAPTLLALAETPYPNAHGGKALPAPMGRSLLPYLQGQTEQAHPQDHHLGFELQGRRGLRQGHWKLSFIDPPRGPGRWQLFDLAEDLGETNDLADAEPERFAAMIALWERYAEEVGLILPDAPSKAQ